MLTLFGPGSLPVWEKWMPYTVLHLGESPILHIVQRFLVCTAEKEVIHSSTVGASFPYKAFLGVLWNRDQEEWPYLVKFPFWHMYICTIPQECHSERSVLDLKVERHSYKVVKFCKWLKSLDVMPNDSHHTLLAQWENVSSSYTSSF